MTTQLNETTTTDITDAEWQTRVDLAACYRIVDDLGWTSFIANHISARVPGTEYLLVNPFGLLYSEVTASNLIKIDMAGNPVGPTEWPLNPAGIVIHTAIHQARADVECIAHTHTLAGSAIAGLADGLDHNNIGAAPLAGTVAYHDFEGVTVFDDEKAHLVEHLGDKYLLVLRNHGLLACGRTIPEAMYNLVQLELACQIQLATLSAGRPLSVVSEEAKARSRAAMDSYGGMAEMTGMFFEALRRKIDAKDPSYRL